MDQRAALTVVAHNPFTFSTRDRKHEVLKALSHAHLIALSGTKTKMPKTKDVWFSYRMGKYRVFEFGYSGAVFTNSSAGVAIAVDTTIFPDACFRNAFAAPADIQGRGGAVLYRTRTRHVLFCAVYCPPGLSETQQTASIRVHKWLRETVCSRGPRVTPIVGGDFNAHVGYHAVEETPRRWQLTDDQHV